MDIDRETFLGPLTLGVCVGAFARLEGFSLESEITGVSHNVSVLQDELKLRPSNYRTVFLPDFRSLRRDMRV